MTDLSVVKEVEKELYGPREDVIFKITITNPGDSNTIVTLVDVLNITYFQDSGQISIDGGLSYLTWSGNGNLVAPANDDLIVYIKGQLRNSSRLVIVTNTASITSNADDPDMTNNTSTVNFRFGTYANISTTKTVDRGPNGVYYQGDPITFTIVIKNNGPSTITFVTLADLFPPEILNPTYSSNGNPFRNWTGTLSINYLDPDDTWTIIISGTIGTPGTCPMYMNNRAEVSSTYTDLVGDISVDVPYVIDGAYDLSIKKKSDKAIYYPGGTVTYTINVYNAGPYTVIPKVYDELPDVIIGGQSNYKGIIRPWEGVITLDPLAADGNIQFDITGVTSESALSNTAMVGRDANIS